jgi:hypothetical protein
MVATNVKYYMGFSFFSFFQIGGLKLAKFEEEEAT